MCTNISKYILWNECPMIKFSKHSNQFNTWNFNYICLSLMKANLKYTKKTHPAIYICKTDIPVRMRVNIHVCSLCNNVFFVCLRACMHAGLPVYSSLWHDKNIYKNSATSYVHVFLLRTPPALCNLTSTQHNCLNYQHASALIVWSQQTKINFCFLKLQLWSQMRRHGFCSDMNRAFSLDEYSVVRRQVWAFLFEPRNAPKTHKGNLGGVFPASI